MLVENKRSVPCRLINLSPEVFQCGTVVGNLTSVDGIIQEHNVPIERNYKITRSSERIASLANQGLSRQQIKNLIMKPLFIHKVDLFSKDDRDFERTDIVKHSMNTESRAQIRQSRC